MNDPGSAKSLKPAHILRKAANGKATLFPCQELDYILSLTINEVKRMVRARNGSYYLYDDSGALQASDPESDMEITRRIAEHVVQTKTGINLKIGSAMPGTDPGDLALREVLRFPIMAVPLGLEEGDVGALVLWDCELADSFFAEDFSLLGTFAVTFSILLRNTRMDLDDSDVFLNFRTGLLLLMENVRFVQRLKLSDQTLHTVLEVSNLINSSRKLREMIDTIMSSAKSIIRAEKASLFLVDDDTGDLVFDIVASQEEELLAGMRVPRGQGIVGLCALEQKTIVVNDAQNDERFYSKVDEVSKSITRNLMASPLVVNGHTIGVMEVLNTLDRRRFTKQDVNVFESFSDSVAIALQHRRILDDLERSNQNLERTIEERQQRLNEITCLHSVAGELVEANSIQDMFERVVAVIRQYLKAGRISIMMYEAKLDKLCTAASAGTNLAAIADAGEMHSPKHSLSYRTFLSGKPAFISDLKREGLSELARPDRYDSNSCILIPMISSNQEKPFGLLCVTDAESGSFSEDDYRLILTIVSQLVRGYENFKLNEEMLLKESMDRELAIASRIQKNILPSSLPQHNGLVLAAKSVMAKVTGGDFYDHYVHDQGEDVSMLVADVSGKSLPAALFMAICSSVLRTIVRSEDDPTRVLELSNELIYEESESGMFVTVFLARYEPARGMLRYASAGHNEMILMRTDGSWEKLSRKGVPLGIIPNQKGKYQLGETLVQAGDLLVLYTDGVIEAIDEANTEYGLESFISLLQELKESSPEEIVDAVYARVVEFAGNSLQYDDFTILVSRFLERPAFKESYNFTLPALPNSVPLLREAVKDICRRYGVVGVHQDDLLLVVDEASTNIVLHAYQDSGIANPGFQCRMEVKTSEYVRLYFEDQGMPFAHDSVQEPSIRANLSGERKGGFGVFLIKRLMDRTEYDRRDGTNYLFAEKRIHDELSN